MSPLTGLPMNDDLNYQVLWEYTRHFHLEAVCSFKDIAIYVIRHSIDISRSQTLKMVYFLKVIFNHN